MFQLPEQLTIHNVKTVQEQLLYYLQQRLTDKEDLTVVLDVGNLQNLDASGLQLLLATAKTVAAQGFSLDLHNAGQEITELLNGVGAAEILQVTGGSKQ